MLEAASTGRWPRTGLDLSSRRWIRRWLRLRRFRRMAFTRNPFLLELMLFGHIHQTPQNTKDFEFFSEFHPSEGETFAWLRTNPRTGCQKSRVTGLPARPIQPFRKPLGPLSHSLATGRLTMWFGFSPDTLQATVCAQLTPLEWNRPYALMPKPALPGTLLRPLPPTGG